MSAPRSVGVFFPSDAIPAGVVDGRDAVVGQRGGMEKSDARLFRAEQLELRGEVVVRGEGAHVGAGGPLGPGGGDAAEADGFVAGAHEGGGEQGAKFAGGEIRQPPDFVDRLVARPAGDDDAHGRRGG